MLDKNRKTILNVCFDPLTMEETLHRVEEIIQNRQITQHVVINVAKLVYAQKNEELRNAINQCALINVDGAGVIMGAKFLDINIPERVAGIDLMENLIKLSSQKGYKLYFLGATEDTLNKAIEVYRDKYPGLHIAGCRNGYFTQEDDVAEKIRNSGADILFVAISSPKKELFLNKYVDFMQVPFVMGVGGSLDITAGRTKRAPLWFQKSCLEWVYRLMQEPGRMWWRYFYTNTAFAFLLIKKFIVKNFLTGKQAGV